MTTAEEQEKAWWDSWREADFSWNGLARQGTMAGETLQSYWAAERDDLYPDPTDPEEDPEKKRRYTRFHLPLTWPDGTPTPKASWTAEEHATLARDLEARLHEAQDQNLRAKFAGVVLQQVPSMPPGKGEDDDLQGTDVDFNHAWLITGTTWVFQVFGNARFDSARFTGHHASFDRVRFTGNASFEEALFTGRASFYNASFKGHAGFDSASFAGPTSFDHARFTGEAEFDSASFRFIAQFDHARFTDRASFHNTSFTQNARFGRARFMAHAWFGSARFTGGASFYGAHFTGDAWFHGASFLPKDPTRMQLTLENAVFQKSCRFHFGEITPYAGYSRRAFHGTRFEGYLYTELNKRRRERQTGPVALPLGAFDGALFKELVFLDKEYAARQKDGIPDFVRQQIASTNDMSSDEREKNLLSIAEGARVLQIAMAKGRNNDAEQLFHKIELIARRETRSTFSIRRILTNLYEWTSDFGGSITRPLWRLAMVWFACGLVYAACATTVSLQERGCQRWHCVATQVIDQSSSALALSTRIVFRPTYVLSVNDKSGHDIEKKLFLQKGPLGRVMAAGLGVLAFAQSLFSIVMLFLTGLAARRYYQLS